MNRKIFEARLAKKNMTKRDMAKVLGIRESRISDMLSGRLRGWKYQPKIADYLDVPLGELFPEN